MEKGAWGVCGVDYTLVTSVFPLLIIAAGINDYFTFKIPNWLNALIALSVIPFALFFPMPGEVFAWHVVAGIVAMIAAFTVYAMGLIGGGDAKMIGACALWVGWEALMSFMIVTVIAGGVLALAMTVWGYLSTKQEADVGEWAKNLFSKKPDLPYGIAIAAGGIIVFPGTWWIQQF